MTDLLNSATLFLLSASLSLFCLGLFFYGLAHMAPLVTQVVVFILKYVDRGMNWWERRAQQRSERRLARFLLGGDEGEPLEVKQARMELLLAPSPLPKDVMELWRDEIIGADNPPDMLYEYEVRKQQLEVWCTAYETILRYEGKLIEEEDGYTAW